MTSTEIALRQPASVAVTERDVVDGWITVIADVAKLADHIAETDFVPKALRNRPAAVAACILTGRELGIGPMASLKSIHMVQGVPSLSAEYKRARALAAGHEIVIDESNATRCVVRGRRAGEERWVTITWTLDMAKRAKLAAKDVWQQYPQRMLQARASSELCDLIFPDATLGLETTEILEDGGALAVAVGAAQEGSAELTAAAPPAIEAPKPRTAQRRTRQAAPAPAGQPATQETAAEPRPTSAPTAATSGAGTARTGTDSGLPPLPGEDEPDPTTSGASSSAAAPDGASPRPTGGSSPNGSGTSGSEADKDAPGSVTRPQLTKIWTIFSTQMGFTADEKAEARAACEVIIGRALAGDSTNDMSLNEAKAVIDTLERCEDRGALMELLVAAEAAKPARSAREIREATEADGSDG